MVGDGWRGALGVLMLAAALSSAWGGSGCASPSPAATPGPAASAAPVPESPAYTVLGRNEQGFEEVRWEKDGSVLVVVPAGSLEMGSKAEDDEKPVHRVDLPDYLIGKYEVTNEQFERFVEATGYEAGAMWRMRAQSWGLRAPVVDVSWYDARAYCQWAGLRLPKEAEWESAARGTDGRTYPWGKTEDFGERAWYIENSVFQPHEVGTKPAGMSPHGCLDLAGNVWEWCSDPYGPYGSGPNGPQKGDIPPPSKVLRGGSWNDGTAQLRGANRSNGPPEVRDWIIGFRVSLSRLPGPPRP